ncbi:MAG TPA: hypothetical protein VE548_02785 [Nitrososphaeraceae archaeon]|jgi:hypothetical protein|nr:hypothetical protein [Nitrososphaeraceae archaeon]
MKLEQLLEKELEESKLWLSREHEESTYKRDLTARIELLSWVLKNMKNPDLQICSILECRIRKIILKINQTHSIIDSDKLHSELRILNWILYQVCNR